MIAQKRQRLKRQVGRQETQQISMASQSSIQKAYLLKIVNSPSSFKFWLVTPLVILILLLILYLASPNLTTNPIIIETFRLVSISLLVIIILPLLFTHQITRRIDQIIKAAGQVAEGDFTIQIDDDQNDQIGRLVQAFNQMVVNLDQLQRSRDLLSRTMSPAVRQSLIEQGLDFRGITQTVSILFIDIWGFTRITERHNTEQLVFFLNDYYTSIANLVHSSGGIIGKYGGDSIMAFFGAPNPQPAARSSTAALLTALALHETIEELSDRWIVLGLPPIRVGIGLSTGPVVAGPIGSIDQFEYTVIGDAVNLAARLQDLTRTISGYSIILAAETYELLEERVQNQLQIVSLASYEELSDREKARRPVQLVDLGEVLVKGKNGPVHVYGIPDYDPDSQDNESKQRIETTN